MRPADILLVHGERQRRGEYAERGMRRLQLGPQRGNGGTLGDLQFASRLTQSFADGGKKAQVYLHGSRPSLAQ